MNLEAGESIQEQCTVVFYDGACGMCNAVVMRILEWDEAKAFFYASLQSDYAASVLPEQFTQNLSTVVLLHQGKRFIKSSAILEILKIAGKYNALSSTLAHIPRFPRDLVYGVVAKCRHLFGKPTACRLLSEEEQARFLS